MPGIPASSQAEMRPVTAEQTHRKELSREQEPSRTGGAFRVTWVLCKLCQVEKGWEAMGRGKMCWMAFGTTE